MSCDACPFRAELITKAEDAIVAKNDLLATIETLSRKLRTAENKLTTKHATHPLADAIQAWLDYWQARLSNGKADIRPGSDRWARCLRAMERKASFAEGHNLSDPVEWALSELKLAVDGLVLSPWHMGQNPKHKRYTKVENVLKDDETTDEFIEAGRRAQAEPVEIPLRWLSPGAQQRIRQFPWLLPLLRDALDSACDWNNQLEQELQEYREFREVTTLEVAA